MNTEPPVYIATDGSSKNDGSGGWAFCALHAGAVAKRYGCKPFLRGLACTNNVMELTAIARALQFVRPAPGRRLVIQTDSAYAQMALECWHKRWAESGWVSSTGKPVSNKKLICAVLKLIERQRAAGTVVLLQKVRGHNGHEGNEAADKLAGEARKKKRSNWKPNDNKLTQ